MVAKAEEDRITIADYLPRQKQPIVERSFLGNQCHIRGLGRKV